MKRLVHTGLNGLEMREVRNPSPWNDEASFASTAIGDLASHHAALAAPIVGSYHAVKRGLRPLGCALPACRRFH